MKNNMDIEKIKEEMSICYLQAITSVNGIALERYHHDDDSTDITLNKIISVNEMEFNSQIRVQLKSTSSPSQYTIRENDITYRLKVKNYNDLCMPSVSPSMLALLILPENEDEWISWNTDELILRGQMYWAGFQNNEKSDNENTVSIKIPKSNILNNVTVNNLIIKAAEEGSL